jgi:hypothetical protein
LIALSIVAIGLVALLQLQVVSIGLFDRAQLHSRAALLAEAKLAEVLSQGFPELGSDSGTVDEEEIVYTFEWQTTVEEVKLPELEEAGAAELRRVHVEVRWQDGSQQRKVEMATLVTGKK